MNLARRQFVLAGWLCWLLCGTNVFALDPTKAITQYVHDVWSTNEGLPGNSVMAIAQTRDGYLWFGTYEGLVRFDGIRFTVFDETNTPEIKYRFFYALCADKDGGLWSGTLGKELLHYKDGKFTRYPLPNQSPSNGISRIYQDRTGRIWVVANDEFYRYEQGRFLPIPPPVNRSDNFQRPIYQDSTNTLWTGGKEGLFQFKDENFVPAEIGQRYSLRNVDAIYEDRNGALWIGAQVGTSAQRALLQCKDGQCRSYGKKEGFTFNGLTAILEDHDGNLWMSNYGSGVLRFRDGKFTPFTTKEALSDDAVNALFEDQEGNLWMGTEARLNRLRDGKFSAITQVDGLPHDSIISVYEDREGRIWLGSWGGGLSQFKAGRITNYAVKDGLASQVVTTLRQDKRGNLWVGTNNGLNLFQQGKIKTYAKKDGLTDRAIWAIQEDHKGALWFGTADGLFRLAEGRFRQFTTEDGLAGQSIISLLEDRQGTLWIGTTSGLNQFREGKLTSFNSPSAPQVQVKTLYEDQEGYLWIGMQGQRVGLFRYKDGQFTQYTTKDGLFDDVVYSILEDEQGNFWMSSGRGIFRTSRQGLQDFAAGKSKTITCTAYDVTDGLLNRECNAGPEAGRKTRDGRLWFGTYKGVVVIDPANIRYNKLPPPVVIEQAIADNATFSLAQPQQLAAGTQNLEFQYAGLSLVAAEKNQYKYQLVGYDKAWIEAGNRRTAYYTNLRPGNYTFRVIASNNDGVWNETGAAYSFSLKPYFWQTWWFYGLCIGGIGLAGFGLNNLRTKRVMAREREKTQLKIAELRLEKAQVQAQAIEAENNRKTQELEEARRLQLSMLPKGNVQLERLEITGTMRTATEVGGDYYYFLPLPDGRYCVVIGDATGHGMSAGLIVGMVKMGLTSRLQAQPQLTPMIEDLNTALKQSLTHRGVGMCLGATILDPVTLQVELCSNGMPFPYHFTNGALRAIELKAQPLGFLKRVNVPTATLQLQTGEALIWVSDGFEERMNPCNEEWGSEQVAAALTEICQREHSGEAIAKALIAACDRASDGRSNDDDMTIVVVKAM
jgi:ligand-binding sensor domain-containing protein/serine phosphatase RsbU (regulator of sigma subunit)